MPAFTDSDDSDIEGNNKFHPMPPLTNSEPKAKRKVLKKRKSKEGSDLVLDSSDDSQGTSSDITTEDDYSDDDHVFLVSSVANLRRRELMNLGPMKTKSKKTHKPRVIPLKNMDKDPVLSLKATKEIIEENLKIDERNVKLRNPKRHLLSEEKWGEGTTWDEIISEGKDREKELALQTLEPEKATKSDKAMILQVPGSEPSEPIVKEKPPPIGYVRRLVEPNGGGELFDSILEASTKMFKLASEAGRNVVSMSTPITLMVNESECNLEKLTGLRIETKKMGSQVILKLRA